MGGELNIVFDNLSGQNKNNMVIRLIPYLIEMGYFKKVNFIFLVVGHTKSAADRLFNCLKEIYRRENVGTMQSLFQVLNTSEKVTVHETSSADFYDWGKFLSLFYRNIEGVIKQNHIFSMDRETCRDKNKLLLDIRESDLEGSKHIRYNMMKQTFHGRKEAATSFSDAIKHRPRLIREAETALLTNLSAPGITPYTQVELHEKFGPCLPPDEAKVTCPKPTPQIYHMVKKEAGDRKKLKVELIEKKRQLHEGLELIAYKDEKCDGDDIDNIKDDIQ